MGPCPHIARRQLKTPYIRRSLLEETGSIFGKLCWQRHECRAISAHYVCTHIFTYIFANLELFHLAHGFLELLEFYRVSRCISRVWVGKRRFGVKTKLSVCYIYTSSTTHSLSICPHTPTERDRKEWDEYHMYCACLPTPLTMLVALFHLLTAASVLSWSNEFLRIDGSLATRSKVSHFKALADALESCHAVPISSRPAVLLDTSRCAFWCGSFVSTCQMWEKHKQGAANFRQQR